MTEAQIHDALDGLHAYDMGSVDSGIHDEALREQVRETLQAMPALERKRVLSHFVTSHCLSDEAVAQGYGPEDALEFLQWLDEEMGLLR